MPKPALSFVLVAENAVSYLPLTLIDLDRHLSESGRTYEIVVVDKGSRDGTGEMLDRFRELIGHLYVITLGVNASFAEALTEGLTHARGAWRLSFPADNSISVVEIEKSARHLDDEAQVVVGVRRMKEPTLASRLVHAFVRLLSGSRTKDPLSPFSFYSVEAVQKLLATPLPHTQIPELFLAARAARERIAIREAPVFSKGSYLREKGALAHLKVLWQACTIRFHRA